MLVPRELTKSHHEPVGTWVCNASDIPDLRTLGPRQLPILGISCYAFSSPCDPANILAVRYGPPARWAE
jgi:hypothetical protein